MNLIKEKPATKEIDTLAAAEYLKTGQPQKCLKLLMKMKKFQSTPWALKVAIQASWDLNDHENAWNFFQSLLQVQKFDEIKEKTLMTAGQSAIQIKKYHEAEKLFLYLGQRKSIKPLPSLENSLINYFGSRSAMSTWKKSINPPELSFSEAIRYAMVLMHENQFSEASEFLASVKSKVMA